MNSIELISIYRPVVSELYLFFSLFFSRFSRKSASIRLFLICAFFKEKKNNNNNNNNTKNLSPYTFD